MFKWMNKKIGNLILTVVIAVFVISAIISFTVNINQYEQAELDSMAKLARALVLNAESARNEMADRFNLGIFKDAKELNKEQVVATVPVVMAWQAAQRKAQEGGYIFKVPKNQPRNPINAPDDFEKKILDRMERGEIDEYSQIDESMNAVRYMKAIKLTQECMLCHGDPRTSMELWGNDKGEDVTGVKMENWKPGDVRGAFEVILSLDKTKAAIRSQFIKNLIGVIIAIIIIIFLIVFFIKKYIETPIAAVVSVAKKISAGDLTDKIKVESENELGQMSVILNEMVDNLSVMISKINTSSSEVSDSSKTVTQQVSVILAASEQTTASINETTETIINFNKNIEKTEKNIANQSKLVDQTSKSTDEILMSFKDISNNTMSMVHSVAQTSAAIEEMMKNISSITSNVSFVNDSANETRETAIDGKKAIQTVIDSMTKISENVAELVKLMENLGNRAMNINNIVNVISEIAEQTNLLALNAAIEAARSGEHGKGFAVVADEVRKLAERSSKSAKEIASIIKLIQNETQNAIGSTKESYELTSQGKKIADDTGSILSKITEKVDSMNGLIKQVNSAITEQNEGGNLILKEVENLTRISREISESQDVQDKSVQDIADSMKNVNNITIDVKKSMAEQSKGSEQVKISMEEINKASKFNLESSEKVSKEVKKMGETAETLAELISKFKITE